MPNKSISLNTGVESEREESIIKVVINLVNHHEDPEIIKSTIMYSFDLTSEQADDYISRVKDATLVFKQICIKREFRTSDEGTCGFHDYVRKYEELDDFLDRVSKELNELVGELKSVQYISGGSDNEIQYAIIVYEATS